MAEDLQGLLNRIHADGVKKAEDEKARILADAKAEAERILADAKAKAEEFSKKAEGDAAASETRAKATIQQASRDVVIALKSELLSRLRAVVKDCVGQAMTPDLMGKIVLEMVKSHREKNPSGELGVETLLTKKDLDEMERLLKGGLLANLQAKPEMSLGHDFAAGLKIGFKGSDVFFDFSDEALADMICEFVGPKLAAAINPSK